MAGAWGQGEPSRPPSRFCCEPKTAQNIKSFKNVPLRSVNLCEIYLDLKTLKNNNKKRKRNLFHAQTQKSTHTQNGSSYLMCSSGESQMYFLCDSYSLVK